MQALGPSSSTAPGGDLFDVMVAEPAVFMVFRGLGAGKLVHGAIIAVGATELKRSLLLN